MTKRYIIFLLLVITSAAQASEALDGPHLPLPRFAALRSGEVNMRTGPGTRYPIAWVYTHRGLPVEVTAEYTIWQRVKDPEGTEGWVNRTELTNKRSVIVTGGLRELRDDHEDTAAIVAHLEEGSVGQVLSCLPDWCKIKFNGTKGYLRKTHFWGAYPDEVFN